MGTSYETLLVAAEFAATVAAVREASGSAIVVPVADQRVAVIPQEGEWQVADLEPLAVRLSVTLGRPVLATWVCDSDFLICVVFEEGLRVHRYVSEQEMTVQWVQEGDEFKPEIDGILYPPDHPLPKGPLGDDAAAFASFAVPPADLGRIGAALRGEIEVDGTSRVWAEHQHWEIMAALGLDPAALTKAYRHVEVADFPGAALVP